MIPHRFDVRVHYEDTDLSGLVYHANYLKFIERGRSAMVADLGLDQRAMLAEGGLAFAVRRLDAEFLAPAGLDDRLVVETGIASATGARLTLHQTVRRGDKLLFSADVVIVCLDGRGRPTRLPPALGRAAPPPRQT